MLEIQISSVFHIHGHGTILAGRVMTGTVAIGDAIEVRSPTVAVRAVVAGLEIEKEVVHEAGTGAEVAVLLRRFAPERLPDGMQPEGSGSWRVDSIRIVNAPKRWWQFW